MTAFLSQSAWAERLGVSVQTFRRWRQAGLIPSPDCVVPGRPRWSLGLVNKTTLIVTVQRRGLFQRREAVGNRQQQGAARGKFGKGSLRHGEKVNGAAKSEQVHSVDGGAR